MSRSLTCAWALRGYGYITLVNNSFKKFFRFYCLYFIGIFYSSKYCFTSCFSVGK